MIRMPWELLRKCKGGQVVEIRSLPTNATLLVNDSHVLLFLLPKYRSVRYLKRFPENLIVNYGEVNRQVITQQ